MLLYFKSLFLLFLSCLISRELLQSLTDADLSEEKFPFSTNKMINFAGCKVNETQYLYNIEFKREIFKNMFF